MIYAKWLKYELYNNFISHIITFASKIKKTNGK